MPIETAQADVHTRVAMRVRSAADRVEQLSRLKWAPTLRAAACCAMNEVLGLSMGFLS